LNTLQSEFSVVVAVRLSKSLIDIEWLASWLWPIRNSKFQLSDLLSTTEITGCREFAFHNFQFRFSAIRISYCRNSQSI